MMRRSWTCGVVALLAVGGVAALFEPAVAKPQPAKRCGWIVNPTPANWWLLDRDGQWVIGTQGGRQAEGMDLIPDLAGREWVVTNGSSYGHGCGCMTVDARGHEIRRIHSVEQKPLSACRADRRLPRP